MSTAAIRSSRSSSAADGTASNRGVWIGLVLALALLGLILAWFMGWISFGTDPRVAEIRQLQDAAQKQFAAGGGPSTVADATAAVTSMNTIRAKIDALPPNLRPQVERQGGSIFRSAIRARIETYFAAPIEKRQAELDRQINQEEMMRKAFEAGRAVAGVFGGGGGQGGGQAGSGQGQAQGQGQGQGQGGGPGGGGSEEDRNRWRKSMIDSTTPEQRSRYVEYRRAMEERREQRGLQPGWGR